MSTGSGRLGRGLALAAGIALAGLLRALPLRGAADGPPDLIFVTEDNAEARRGCDSLTRVSSGKYGRSFSRNFGRSPESPPDPENGAADDPPSGVGK